MNISAIILSGGRATRMNGVDKGLVLLHNQPLIQHVMTRLLPQVDEVLVNANREIVTYEALGFNVFKDETDEFLGPLAGFLLGLQHAKHEYLLTAPCDSPLLPLDLAQKLYGGMAAARADIAVASSNGETHPVFCLMKKNVLPSLITFLAEGERKVSAWQKSHAYVEIDFSDDSDAFTNLNTLEDLNALELKNDKTPRK